ncbi:MAG: CopG family transcriptional regulator [Candidatus Rokubacteria bacterium]|nr:CopG family transcriptional regulator [Candidatus Rokubacteria bacterium]
MRIRVRLDPKTESLINQLARQTGRTKSEVIRQALKAFARAEAHAETRTGPYGAIAHLIGSARGGPKDLSERTGKKLRMLLQARRPGWPGFP